MRDAPIYEADPELKSAAEAERKEYRRQGNGHATEAARVYLRSGGLELMQKIEWLWPGWLAAGKLHVIGGQKGAGKSTIVFHIFAQITVGGRWPDGAPAPLGRVLVWSGEDDIRDTILPRIHAAGGDVTRVQFVDSVISNGEKRSFDPATDMPGLIEAARSIPGLKGIMIDPVVSATAGDSHKNAETRRSLQPLVDLAAELGAAVIGITHFTKGTQGREPIERITGSLAFGALPRIVWAAAHGAEEDAPRKFVRIASNIGKSGGGFEYLLRQDLLTGFDFTAQRVVWGKALSGTPLELLGDSEAQSKKLSAIKFLDDILAGGASVKVNDIKAAATAHSLSWPTIERAKKNIGTIVAVQRDRAWYWRKGDGLNPSNDGRPDGLTDHQPFHQAISEK